MMTTATARTALTIFILLLLFSGVAGTLFVFATDPAWVSKAPMQAARSGLGVAVVNGKIYAIGGADGSANGFSSTNEEYDPATNNWTFKAPMPTPRSDFGIAVYENKIYCIGGYVRGGPTAINEVYDPATDTWTNKASMPTARLNLRANAVNGKIYLIGGIPVPDTGRTFNEVYDPTSDSWTTKTPIPTGADSYASAVLGSRIYVMKSGLTQIYDAESDNWTTGVAPPLNSMFPSAAIVSASNSPVRIYLFGANAEGSYWMLTSQGFTTQSYDPTTSSWAVGTSMPTGRFDAGLAAVDDKLYVIGGYSYGARSGLSLNLPIIYSQANEQYTPALDVAPPVDKTQATPTPDTSLPSPSATPAQSPIATPIQTLSPTPTLSPTSTPSSAQTPSLSSSPSASPTSNSGSLFEDVSTSKFPPFLLLSMIAVIAVILVIVIVVAKKKYK